MPKINVYLPDSLADAVRDTGVPVSAICQRALEDSVQRVRAVRSAVRGDLTDLAGLLPQATERTRTAVGLAVTAARESGSATVTTGHLLRGILDEGANMALRVLRVVEVNPARLAAVPLSAEAPAGAPDGLRFSAPAAAAIELTVLEATALGHNYVGCEHLIIGLAAEPDGGAGRALTEAGADAKSLRRVVTAALAGYAHLRATTTPALLTAVRQEIQPLIERIERLEARPA